MKEKPLPPKGIHTDYNEIFAIEIGGKIDDQLAKKVLETLVNTSIKNSLDAVENSYSLLGKLKSGGKFINLYLAFREVGSSYPISPENWTSGERIPGVHAEEIALESMILALQAHYKSAFHKLREVIELIILQFYFLLNTDKEIIGKWGRAEIRTPQIRSMLKYLNNSKCFQEADKKLNISNHLYQIYDDLGAYVHTRGIPSTTMGLTGSNILKFSKNAFEKYMEFGSMLFKKIILLSCVFFPTAIIDLPAFQKFGYFDPIWIPKKEKVEFIRTLIPPSELKILEDLAKKNSWFTALSQRVSSLKNLDEEEIEETYAQFMELQKDIKKFKNYSKVIDLKLYVPYTS